MDGHDLGTLLGRLREHYRTDEPSDQMVDDWWHEFADTPTDTMNQAATAVIAKEQFHPKIARFREYVRLQNPTSRMTQPVGTCPFCDGTGWRESTTPETATAVRDGKVYEFTYPAGVYPCQHCQPKRHARWRDEWVPEARRTRPVTSTTTFDYNPASKLAEARKILANAGDLTRNTADLEDPDAT